MKTEFVSLRSLLQNEHYEVYEQVQDRLPRLFQPLLTQSVWITFTLEVALLSAFVVLPQDVFLTGIRPGGLFFLEPATYIVNTLLGICYTILPYIMLLNLISLFVTLSILTVTVWMTKPASLQIMNLATINLIPVGISLSIVGFVTAAFVITLIATIVIGIVVVIVVIALLGIGLLIAAASS